MIYLNIEVYPGSHIHAAARGALELANKLYVEVRFKFNGIELSVQPTYSTKIEDQVLEIADMYDRLKRINYDDSNKSGEIGAVQYDSTGLRKLRRTNRPDEDSV